MTRRLLLALVRYLRQQVTRRDVSETWLQEQARAESRNTFEGISIRWPIQKQANEAGKFNSARLKRRA